MLFSNEVQKNFVKEVEKCVLSGNDGYIEAILFACEEFEIEPQVAAKFLPKPIIEKIEAEGRRFNMLPKNTSQLPV
tara:strand:- start:1572 stop:1799 length:228 start_codon:yes stop_codon:yes gene_type:complete